MRLNEFWVAGLMANKRHSSMAGMELAGVGNSRSGQEENHNCQATSRYQLSADDQPFRAIATWTAWPGSREKLDIH